MSYRELQNHLRTLETYHLKLVNKLQKINMSHVRKMKIAKRLLYKNGDNHHFTNYRPVSLLPQFSKILENLVAARLNKFINKHNLLTDSHYRFRPNRFTSLAVIELVEKNHSKILRPKELCSWFHSLTIN